MIGKRRFMEKRIAFSKKLSESRGFDYQSTRGKGRKFERQLGLLRINADELPA